MATGTDLSGQLTILLTTSPSRSNPSTLMIAQVLKSMTVIPGLQSCPLVVTCDGCVVQKNDSEVHEGGPSTRKWRARKGYRSGVVSTQGSSLYEEYKESLATMFGVTGCDEARDVPSKIEWPGGTALVEFNERQGFAHGVRIGLEDSVLGERIPAYASLSRGDGVDGSGSWHPTVLRRRTAAPRGGKPLSWPTKSKYVIVIQHDRNFERTFDLPGLLAAMDADPRLKSVMCLTSSVVNHAHRMNGRLKGLHDRPVEGDKVDMSDAESPTGWEWVGTMRKLSDGLHVFPLLSWLDATHVCPVSHYRDFIFGGGWGRLKRGSFIEDTLGQAQVAALHKEGFVSHNRFGSWILDDGSHQVLTKHLDSKSFDVDRHAKRQKMEGGDSGDSSNEAE